MRRMHGLMMDFPLTLTAIFRRAETLFGPRAIVSRLPDRSLHRYTYADFTARTRRLIRALADLGIRPGDRVATLAWNHHQHLEAYFAAPLAGAVLHTLNLRLHPDELAYIVNHAEDRALIVDQSLLPVYECIRARVNIPTVIVVGAAPEGTIGYEALVAGTPPADDLPEPDEADAAALCYTTGTTGRPKGVLFSHRSLTLHSLGLCLPDAIAIGEGDVVLPIVPMFHANAWGFPHACTMTGSGMVLPGPLPRSGERAGPAGARAGDDLGGRADDLDGRAPGARRGADTVRPVGAALRARGRRGARAAR